MLYLKTDGEYTEWNGSAIGSVLYPRSIEHLWDSQDLAEIGLYVPLPAGDPPAGKRVVSTRVDLVNGRVQFIDTYEAIPAPSPADFQLSRRQVRKAMLHAGIPLNGVDAALASLPAGEARDLAIIDWQDAPVYLRSHPMFDMMAPIFGITPAQLDALWIWAASLDA